MSGTLDTHALARSVHALAMDGVVDLDKRRAKLAMDGLGEFENQFQIPISGLATATAVWQSVAVTFDVEFYEAQQQRDSPLTLPHFTYGALVNSVAADGAGSEQGGKVAVVVNVTGFTGDDRAITGANVVVGVFVPGGGADQDFDGYVHLSFQGFGAVAENNIDLDVGT